MRKLDKRIYFKQSKKSNKEKLQLFAFKKKDILGSNIKSLNRGNRFSKGFKVVLLSIFSIILLVLLLNSAYKYILSLRGDNKTENIETVYGFDIKTYPNSEFIFKNTLDNDNVKSFLSSGNSLYRLPKGTEISEVYEYYKNLLPQDGWQYVGFVEITSEEKMYGQYWVKDGKGLRIYSKLNDVWYQYITQEQAQNGLSDIVRKEIARKLLLLTTEKSETLPDYPWRIQYPSEYVAKYYSSEVPSFQTLSFQKIGSNNITYIEPLGFLGGVSYEKYIQKAIDGYNKRFKDRWQLSSTSEDVLNGSEILSGTLIKGKREGNIIVISNNSNNIVYGIYSFDKKDPFYQYLLENLQQIKPFP